MLLPLLPASQRALVGLHVARAQVPVASLALPIATGRSALAVAGVSGGLAVAAQLGLVALFRRARGRPWLSESPGFVAHQLIALVFMSICTLYGGAAWFAPTAWAGDAASRFLLTDGTTRFLAAIYADTYVPGPPYERRRAACPEAPHTVRPGYAYQPRACRTYRVLWHHRHVVRPVVLALQRARDPP